MEAPVAEELGLELAPGDVVVSRAIRYGSIAHFLGRAAQPTKTHKWCLFFRGAQNEPLNFVRSVEFHLHESFAEPVRVLTAPPFEVHETGWGEFELRMVVNFVDPKEEPVVLLHMLRLHTEDGKPPGRAPVVSEMADDIVFVNPSLQMIDALKREPGVLNDVALPHPLLQEVVVRAGDTPDEAEIRLLKDATAIVKQRAAKVKSDIDAASVEAATLRERLEEAIAKRCRVNSEEAVALWKPEDFRHVPMMAEHDTGVKKVRDKRREQFLCLTFVMSRRNQPLRSTRVRRALQERASTTRTARRGRGERKRPRGQRKRRRFAFEKKNNQMGVSLLFFCEEPVTRSQRWP